LFKDICNRKVELRINNLFTTDDKDAQPLFNLNEMVIVVAVRTRRVGPNPDNGAAKIVGRRLLESGVWV
jgi:hypothetical protein